MAATTSPWAFQASRAPECKRPVHGDWARLQGALGDWTYRGIPIPFLILEDFVLARRAAAGEFKSRTSFGPRKALAGLATALASRLPPPALRSNLQPGSFLVFSDDSAAKGMIPAVLLKEALAALAPTLLLAPRARDFALDGQIHNCLGLDELLFGRVPSRLDLSRLIQPSQFSRPLGPVDSRLRGLGGLSPVAPSRFPFWLHYQAMVAAQRLEVGYQLFQALRPAGIYLNKDYGPQGAALCSAAHLLGIPTYSMLHGLQPEACSCQPVVADKVFCWGDESRRWYLGNGNDPARVLVTGNPSFDRLFQRASSPQALAQTRQEHGLPLDRRVVLFGSNPIPFEQNSLILTALLEAARAQDFLVLHKPHPAEPLEPYRRAFEDPRHLVLVPASQMKPDEAIVASDAVVVYHSTLGLEALLAGRPLLVADFLPQPSPATFAVQIPGLCCGNPAALAARLRDLWAGAFPDRDCGLATSRYLESVIPPQRRAADLMAQAMLAGKEA